MRAEINEKKHPVEQSRETPTPEGLVQSVFSGLALQEVVKVSLYAQAMKECKRDIRIL